MIKSIVSYDLEAPRNIDFAAIEGAVESAGYELKTIALTLRGDVEEAKAERSFTVNATQQRFRLDTPIQAGADQRLKLAVEGWKEGPPVLKEWKAEQPSVKSAAPRPDGIE